VSFQSTRVGFLCIYHITTKVLSFTVIFLSTLQRFRYDDFKILCTSICLLVLCSRSEGHFIGSFRTDKQVSVQILKESDLRIVEK
jgi:hypothetical protein